MNTPFAPTQQLHDVDKGAASSRLNEIRPDSSWSGSQTTLPLRAKFTYKPGTNVYLAPSESFFTIRLKLTDVNGNPLTANDNIALSQHAGAMFWSSVRTLLGGVLVEELVHPGEAAVMTALASRSKAWLDTYGTFLVSEAAFADRQNLILNSNTPEIGFKIPSAFWSSSKLVRAADLKVDFNVDADWATRIVESTGGAKVPGTDYNVSIEEIRFYASEYEPEEGIMTEVGNCDIIELNELQIQKAAITGVTNSSTTFGLDSPAFKAFIAYQPANAGADTEAPISDFENANLTNVTVDYAGSRRPQYQYDLDFAAAKTQRAYIDYIQAAFADIDPSGAAVSEEDWRTRQTVFAWKLVTKKGMRSDRIVVNSTHSASYSGEVILGTAHQKRLVVCYSPTDGHITRVSVALTDADLENALANVQ